MDPFLHVLKRLQRMERVNNAELCGSNCYKPKLVFLDNRVVMLAATVLHKLPWLEVKEHRGADHYVILHSLSLPQNKAKGAR